MENRTDLVDVPIVLITANVGSLFEDPERLMQSWLKEFVAKIEKLQPQFLAIHMQEVGGKTYEKNLDCVRNFIKDLCDAEEMKEFSSYRIYLDEDLNSSENFTALGSLYFIHNALKNIKIWNFCANVWELVEEKAIYHGNIEKIVTKDKAKFPQHFFPECKWSRKGFMRTRWEINATVIDLVNIHLFHDASNLAACETFPSVYSKNRRRALLHILERFHLDHKNGVAPLFLFGDFNFRCDTEGVINELTKNLSAHRIESLKSDVTKICYRNSLGDDVLTIGKKEFNHIDHQCKFKESWLRTYDREMEALEKLLVEYAIEFPPTYPYEENPEIPSDYMSTRCPAWCDRILMSPIAKKVTTVQNDADSSKNIYNVIGEHVCMGDHKPVYLNIRLKANQGNVTNNLPVMEHFGEWDVNLQSDINWEAKAHLSISNTTEAQVFQGKTSFVQISTITAEELNQKQTVKEVNADGGDVDDIGVGNEINDTDELQMEVQKSAVLKETRV